jgi:hypothetical protein
MARGAARPVSRLPSPLLSAFPAGNGARAHGLRAKAGATFIYLFYFILFYRPLSIPSVACRLWGIIINQRLLDATKDVLPDTMFGFRPSRRTADPLLILRHLMDMQRAGVGSKFGVAFMDLSAAYCCCYRSYSAMSADGPFQPYCA